MKKILSLMAILCMFVACDKSPNQDTPTPEAGKIEFPGDIVPEPVLGSDASSTTINFVTNASWKIDVATKADSWISVAPDKGEAGEATVTITAKENDSYDDRSAVITIVCGSASKKFSVTQKQKDAITVTKSRFEAEAEESEIKIEVKANVEFDYKIDEKSASWITPVKTKGLVSTELSFKLAENEELSPREGAITFTSGDLSETITILQKGTAPAIILSQKEYVVDSDANQIKVEVSSNVDVTVNIPDVEWITEDMTKAMSTHTYVFNIEENKEYDYREAEIIFTNTANNLSEKVTVTQAQKDAIILAKSEYEVSAEESILELNVNTNVEYQVEISDSWITQTETKGLRTDRLSFRIAANDTEEGNAREASIRFIFNDISQTVKIKQGASGKALVREALVAFYNATGGDNWTYNANWCSDRPIEEWFGVSSTSEGYYLQLPNNNLNGSLPKEIGNIVNLLVLELRDNPGLSGEIPEEIGNCTELFDLVLQNCSFTAIPESIGNCTKLQRISLARNKISEVPWKAIGKLSKLNYMGRQVGMTLEANQLSGTLPEDFALSLGRVDISDNKYSGKLPSAVTSHENWKTYWPYVIQQSGTGFDLEGTVIPAPEFAAYDTNGNLISSETEYRENKLTMLLCWAIGCPWSESFIDSMVSEYDSYKSKGLEVIGYYGFHNLPGDEHSESSVNNFIQEKGIKWPNLEYGSVIYDILWVPMVVLVDNKGEVVFQDLTQNRSTLFSFIDDYLYVEEGEYESTDYSADGKVKTLQTASKGLGIDIVLMGDGYSDRMIADGTYEQVMKDAMEYLFYEEPYKTFRDHFNVYMVYAVSKTEDVENGETVFSTEFGEGTYVEGNAETVLNYASKASSNASMAEALIVVMMNSKKYAGTCWMYYSSATSGDYGNGFSISYFPVGKDATAFRQVLNHEANGHGFAKLDDEYAYEYMGAFPDEAVPFYETQESWGWWKNTDNTNDEYMIKWAHFLQDERYKYDGLGIFEGGSTYWTNIWRPTEYSIMRYNTGGFNAPSREAIYYRIHKLAYGADWVYDYEDFVEYDAVNRKTAASAANYVEKPQNFTPLARPVVVNKSWDEVMNGR